MQEIECINRELVLPTVHPSQQSIEIWGPISTEEAQFSVQDHGLRRNGRQRLRQERQPFRPIRTAPTVETDLAAAHQQDISERRTAGLRGDVPPPPTPSLY